MHAQLIPVAQIRPDPRGQGYLPPSIEWLAEDIRQRGVLRPVLVRAAEHGDVIVHGERRWRAAQMLGLKVSRGTQISPVVGIEFSPPG